MSDNTHTLIGDVDQTHAGAEADGSDAADAELTPAERRRRRVRELILAAAEKVFAEEGAEGLSIRRLADEIDYSPAAIYKYFGSKDDLVDELKEAFFRRLTRALEQTRADNVDADTLDCFRACIASYMYTALERPHHYLAAFSGVRPSQGDGEDARWADDMQSSKGRAYLMLRDMVSDVARDDRFRDVDPAIAAKSLWASVHGAASLMIHLPSFPSNFPDTLEINRDAFIQAHADLLVRGISAPRI